MSFLLAYDKRWASRRWDKWFSNSSSLLIWGDFLPSRQSKRVSLAWRKSYVCAISVLLARSLYAKRSWSSTSILSREGQTNKRPKTLKCVIVLGVRPNGRRIFIIAFAYYYGPWPVVEKKEDRRTFFTTICPSIPDWVQSKGRRFPRGDNERTKRLVFFYYHFCTEEEKLLRNRSTKRLRGWRRRCQGRFLLTKAPIRDA